MRWQIGSRLLSGAVAVPFVNGTRLLAKHGMTGATGNIYCGLHEFEDMGLVLHALRPKDIFVDAGANIGSYTILAAGACEALAIAIEPVPSTFVNLIDNIRLNNLQALVTAKNIALGASQGHLRFTTALDTVNHVLSAREERSSDAISVPVDTIDSILDGQNPAVIKIDVEGYETEVINGAKKTLQAETLLAVLMEITGSENRYGFDESELHSDMVSRGFIPCAYDPMTRVLTQLDIRKAKSGNTLYVRDTSALSERVKTAPQRVINGTLL
jgi:FkbM family methyltransferase